MKEETPLSLHRHEFVAVVKKFYCIKLCPCGCGCSLMPSWSSLSSMSQSSALLFVPLFLSLSSFPSFFLYFFLFIDHNIEKKLSLYPIITFSIYFMWRVKLRCHWLQVWDHHTLYFFIALTLAVIVLHTYWLLSPKRVQNPWGLGSWSCSLHYPYWFHSVATPRFLHLTSPNPNSFPFTEK